MNRIISLLSKGHSFYTNKAKYSASIIAMLTLLLVNTTANAGAITSFNVFGDSLSDAGALKTLLPSACPPPPYYDCRFSNGPVYAELVANRFGLSADSAYAGGTNWAIGGQRTDEVLNNQVATYLAMNAGVADSDGLYVIWAGANDNFQNDPAGTFDPLNSVENLINSILNLSAAGAVNFFVPNVPIADAWGATFNTALSSRLNDIESGLNIIEFDAFSFFADVTFNPAKYGLVDSTTPCFTGVSVCADPDSFGLWDAVHPTAAGHRIIANAVTSSILTSVSAPATIAVFGFGMLMLVATRRKSKS